jgi:hypothetical protein
LASKAPRAKRLYRNRPPSPPTSLGVLPTAYLFRSFMAIMAVILLFALL